ELLSMKSRRLRISRTQRDSRCTHPPFRLPLPMPFLRLQGRWLDEAGFAIGADVRVEVSAGRLVLEVIDPAQTQA
ncbi:MAG: SymE family type I addiction module toxin, partial [Steroidobacteraceae bacterium]